jgi:putative hydrolase
VCLHEETHRLQFGGVPWLADHLKQQVVDLAQSTDLESTDLNAVVDKGLALVGRLLRGDENASLLDLVQSEDQKVIVDRITAVMSLLEGHADVVMDGVGPEVVPSVVTMRQRFGKRRKGKGPLDRTVRRLLGLEPRCASTGTGRRSFERWSTRREPTASRRSGSPRTLSRRQPRSPTPRPGAVGCSAEPAVMGGRLDPAVALARRLVGPS